MVQPDLLDGRPFCNLSNVFRSVDYQWTPPALLQFKEPCALKFTLPTLTCGLRVVYLRKARRLLQESPGTARGAG